MSAHVNSHSLRVLVVDDHELFRIGLRQLLESEGLDVADAGSVEAALRRLPGLAPDVVVIGMNRPGAPAGGVMRLIAEAASTAAVLMLALVVDHEQVLEAVTAGAAGFLPKDSELGEIVAGIRSLAAAHSALSPQVGRILIDHLRQRAGNDAAPSCAQRHQLSERERQVLSLLASGCDNAEIGDILFV